MKVANDASILEQSPLGERLCTLGVVADIQHADIPDGRSFHGVPRFYRNAVVALRRAVTAWRQADVSHCLNLGDILDAQQAARGREASDAALSAVLTELDALKRPHHHLLGNHCLWNLPREVLNERLRIQSPHEGRSYHSFEPHPGWRIIFLDAYDFSPLGWPEGHPLHAESMAVLLANNPNKGDLCSPVGLEGEARRFVLFGGGASVQQVDWLRDELAAAKAGGQRAIVCCHIPLQPGTAPPTCLLWNYADVLQVVRRSGVVAATITGHSHQCGYALDEAGVHHVVLPSVVETPPARDAFGLLHLHEHGLHLVGVDAMLSMRMPWVTGHAQRPQHGADAAQSDRGP